MVVSIAAKSVRKALRAPGIGNEFIDPYCFVIVLSRRTASTTRRRGSAICRVACGRSRRMGVVLAQAAVRAVDRSRALGARNHLTSELSRGAARNA
jgi:hypothetical protein